MSTGAPPCVPIHDCHPTSCVLRGQQVTYNGSCTLDLKCDTSMDCGGYCQLEKRSALNETTNIWSPDTWLCNAHLGNGTVFNSTNVTQQVSKEDTACEPIHDCHPNLCVPNGQQLLHTSPCNLTDLQCNNSMDCGGYCKLNDGQCKAYTKNGTLLSATEYKQAKPIPVNSTATACVPIHDCHPDMCVPDGYGLQLNYTGECSKDLKCNESMDCGGYCKLDDARCKAYTKNGTLLNHIRVYGIQNISTSASPSAPLATSATTLVLLFLYTLF